MPGNGGLIPSGGTSSSSAGTSGGTTSPGGDGTTCASGMQSTTPVTPTVWLVVDGSTSMDDDFEGGRTRWQALRSTLMDPGGVVDALQASVLFGMVIYAGGDRDSDECVQLVTVQPALNNLSQLTAQYPMAPLAGGTPTDKALDHVVNNLPVLNSGMLDQSAGPIYVVLATDGQPNDRCAGRGGGGGGDPAVEQRVVDITTQGTKNGMEMFVISLAGTDTSLQDHLNNVAAATASKTPPFAPSTQGDLIAAFQKIVGSATCQVSLKGSVKVGEECGGTVKLNGVSLTCNAADGWKLLDDHTVQITGSACDMFLKTNSMVVASFPCEIFTPG